MNHLEEDVMEISRKLSKMAEGSKMVGDMSDAATELIGALEVMPVDIDVLTRTRIGMVLNEFRKKTNDEKLAKRCKALIKRWKALLDEKINARSKSPEERKSIGREEKADSPAASGNRQAEPQKRNGTTVKDTAGEVGMDIRDKSVQMLVNALKNGELPSGSLDPGEIAKRIEKGLFDHHRGTGDKYKAALRSRVFNLRDKKNQALKENVLTGAVSAEKFAIMTTEEMASEEMKKVREHLTKESILEHQMSVQEGTPTDMFRCHKCGSKVCTYSQMQTRSADEPMTTFVFCRSCGNRWKFC